MLGGRKPCAPSWRVTGAGTKEIRAEAIDAAMSATNRSKRQPSKPIEEDKAAEVISQSKSGELLISFVAMRRPHFARHIGNPADPSEISFNRCLLQAIWRVKMVVTGL